jgi:nucleotide-binding universal stress UspA family protein
MVPLLSVKTGRFVKVEAYLRVGYPFDEIALMANHFDVDLIIIGFSRPHRDHALARWQHC